MKMNVSFDNIWEIMIALSNDDSIAGLEHPQVVEIYILPLLTAKRK
jgi:hypothetical protein